MVKQKTIDIGICFLDHSGSYSKFAATTIVSVLENNKQEKLVFHILYQGLEENKIKIITLIKSFNQEVFFYEDFKEYQPLLDKLNYLYQKGKKEWSFGIFYMLLIPLVVPKRVNKILYLDCDIIVSGSLRTLFNVKMEKSLAVNYALVDKKFSPLFFKHNLKYYFNSGVILFNLKKIKTKYLEEIIALYEKNIKVINYPDQDLLTLYFQEEIEFLEVKYNYCIYEAEQLRKNLINNNIVIYHLIRKFFQCNPDFSHPTYKKLYFGYLDLTPWAGWRPKKNIVQSIMVTTRWGEILDNFFYKIKVRSYLKRAFYFFQNKRQ